MQPDRAPVDPHETLFVPRRRRFVSEYLPREDGTRELHLYFGLQEIAFDEPDLFPWAEKLIQQDSFMAGSATTWSSEPLEWARVKDLLETLLEAGILERAAPREDHGSLWRRALRLLRNEEARRAPAEPRFVEPQSRRRLPRSHRARPGGRLPRSGRCRCTASPTSRSTAKRGRWARSTSSRKRCA